MSVNGTWQTTALNSSGRCTITALTSNPPLLPPWMPRCRGLVTRVSTRCSATAMKSSNDFWRFSRCAALCQVGPNSPPPRMFDST